MIRALVLGPVAALVQTGDDADAVLTVTPDQASGAVTARLD
jgi:hypothetical protein